MTLNVGSKRLLQNVLYYSTLAVLAMPWGHHRAWSGHDLEIRLVLIAMVAAAFVLSGRGSCSLRRG